MVVGDINWNYVSLPCLMEIVQNRKISQNQQFQELFKKEIVLRAKFSDELISKLTEPRFSYRNSQQETVQELKKEEDCFIKKVIIDNNFNFLFDFIQNTLNPI